MVTKNYNFRGKSKYYGTWVYGYYVAPDIICKGYKYGDHAEILLVGAEEVDPKTVGQYVGYRGKNNKKIYEGDIVKLNFIDPKDQVRPAIGIVKWEEEYTAFVVEEIQSGKYRDGKYVCDFYFYNCPFIPECEGYKNPSFHWKELEILGNIHDDPELAKTK